MDGRSCIRHKLMQPQINTLYVGNLPAISPPTHPPSYLEDSLRAMFQQSPGFKRMSFRQKINGPMCFVEYEDVGFATRAIRDLYGNGVVCFSASSNLLSALPRCATGTFGEQTGERGGSKRLIQQNGLVKGGIRLSYSKNSLGQRGGSHPPSSLPLPLSLIDQHQHPHPHQHPHSPTMSTAIPTAIFTGMPGGAMSAHMTSPHLASMLQQQQQQQRYHAQVAHQPLNQDAPSFSSLGLSSPPRTRPGPVEPGVGASASSKEGGLSPTAAPFKIPTDPTSPRNRFAIPAMPPLAHASSSGSNSNSNSNSGSGNGSGSGSGSLTGSGLGMGTTEHLSQVNSHPHPHGHAHSSSNSNSNSNTPGLAQTPRSAPSLAGSMSGLSMSAMSAMSAMSGLSGPHSGSGSISGSVGATSPIFTPISPGGRAVGAGGGVGFQGWVSSGRGSIGGIGKGGAW